MLKKNYIEINFTMYVLGYETQEEREALIAAAVADQDRPINIAFHPKSAEEINEALKILYPEPKMEIDWRDEMTVWIWPKGYMAQWS